MNQHRHIFSQNSTSIHDLKKKNSLQTRNTRELPQSGKGDLKTGHFPPMTENNAKMSTRNTRIKHHPRNVSQHDQIRQSNKRHTHCKERKKIFPIHVMAKI